MPDVSRSQLALWAAGALAILLLGARYLHHGEDASPAASVRRAAPVRVSQAQGYGAIVHVAGAVRRPGVYRFAEGARVEDAVRRAGGPTRRADLAALNLAAKVTDGVQILVPREGASAVPAEVAAGGGPGGTSSAPNPAVGASTPTVNLNTATLEQLETLDGVGPAIAQKILAYRQQHGAFRTVDELDQVSGIGPKKMAALRGQVRV